MVHPMSREARRQKMRDLADALFDELEQWRDAHPDFTFGDLEMAARRSWQDFMGQLLTILINGHDIGLQAQAPCCPRCNQEMRFMGYRERTIHGLEGDTTPERAYYVCPKCPGQMLLPLDHKLALRHDRLSGVRPGRSAL